MAEKQNSANGDFPGYFVQVSKVFLIKYGAKRGFVLGGVYGQVWHLSRNYGFSFAAQGTIADELCLSRPTVNVHLQTLVDDGYLEDLDPELDGSRKRYRPTDKLQREALEQWPDGNNPEGVKKSNTPVGISNTVINKPNTGVGISNTNRLTTDNQIEKKVEVQENSLSIHAPRDGEIEFSNSAATSVDLIHPAIEALQKVLDYQIPKSLHDRIIERLGNNPDIAKLEQTGLTWIGFGWSKKNIEGILDKYENGFTETKHTEKKPNEPENPYIIDEEPGTWSKEWCPQEFHLYAMHFVNEAKIYPYKAREKRKWIKELQQFWDNGIDHEIIGRAIDHMQNQPKLMTIASPKSVFAVALSLQIQENTWKQSVGVLSEDEI